MKVNEQHKVNWKHHTQCILKKVQFQYSDPLLPVQELDT